MSCPSTPFCACKGHPLSFPVYSLRANSCEFWHARRHTCKNSWRPNLHCKYIQAGCSCCCDAVDSGIGLFFAPTSLLLVHHAWGPLNFQGDFHPHMYSCLLAPHKWDMSNTQQEPVEPWIIVIHCVFLRLMTGKGCWTEWRRQWHTPSVFGTNSNSPPTFSLLVFNLS